jgi:hypothetical protein
MLSIESITQVLRGALRRIDGINDRVFPLVASQGTTYPYIVYRRQSMTVETTKDGPTRMMPTFEVQIVTANHAEGLTLVDQAIHYLTRIGVVGGVTYTPVFESFSEEWIDETFIQTIVVTI